MSRRSIQHTLDVTWGVLLVFVVGSGSLALLLAREQRRDAVAVTALSQQELMLADLTHRGLSTLQTVLQGEPVSPDDRAALLAGIERMAENLSALESGGQLLTREDRWVDASRFRDIQLQQHLQLIRLWWDEVRGLLREIASPELLHSNRETLEALLRRVQQRGGELLGLLEGLSVSAEQWALRRVVRLSYVQLLLMTLGGVLFFLGIWVLQNRLVQPVQQMAQEIDTMRRTGRLVDLSVSRADELGLVATKFNDLVERLNQQQRRLEEHVVQLRRVNRELERLSQVKEQFFASVSHELRTPLTIVLQSVELLQSGTLGSLTNEQREFLRIALEHGAALKQLIANILQLATLRAGEHPLTRQPGDLASLLRDAVQAWEPLACRRLIQLSLGELKPVLMDRGAIREVLDHLLQRAVAQTQESDTIAVRAALRGDAAEVTIADPGPMLLPDQFDRFFQPLEHLDAPDALGVRRTGLELAICRAIVELHGGSIRTDSGLGGGTAVTFTLPVAKAEPAGIAGGRYQ